MEELRVNKFPYKIKMDIRIEHTLIRFRLNET
jgi:hypothetical protein